jgi:hypothetical protein
MRELMLGEFGVNMFNWQQLYGPAVRLKGCFGVCSYRSIPKVSQANSGFPLKQERRLLLSDPRGLQVVLGDNFAFPRSTEHRELARILMGEGILWAEGGVPFPDYC